jgi:hypothetical protein
MVKGTNMTVKTVTPEEFNKILALINKSNEVAAMSKDPALPLSLSDKLALIAASKALRERATSIGTINNG